MLLQYKNTLFFLHIPSHYCVCVTLLALLMIYTWGAPLVSHVSDNHWSLYTFLIIHKLRAVSDHSSSIAPRPVCEPAVHSWQITLGSLNLVDKSGKTPTTLCSKITLCSHQIWPVSAMKYHQYGPKVWFLNTVHAARLQQIRLALGSSTKSAKLVTEEARWEYFFSFGGVKCEPSGVYFTPWRHGAHVELCGGERPRRLY